MQLVITVKDCGLPHGYTPCLLKVVHESKHGIHFLIACLYQTKVELWLYSCMYSSHWLKSENIHMLLGLYYNPNMHS